MVMSTETLVSFSKHIVLYDTVPRTISASTAIVSGIETAPTKRSATAKLAIRMLEFVFSPFPFLMAKITKIFRQMIQGQAATATLMVSRGESVCFKSHLNCDKLGQKKPDSEELFNASPKLLTFISLNFSFWA